MRREAGTLTTVVCWHFYGVILRLEDVLSPLGLINMVLVTVVSTGVGLAGVALFERVVHRTADTGPNGPADEIRAGPAEH